MKSRSRINEYWQDNGLARLVADFDRARSADRETPIAPVIADLVRLHRLVREQKRFTVIEFGVGYSTLIFADALQANESEYRARPRAQIRLNDQAFRVHSVDANPSWIANVSRGLPKDLASRVELHHSPVSVTTFGGHLCHMHERLPDVVADFIYVDGPDPRDVRGEVRGLGFSSGRRVPVAGDILLMESTLLPGTMILIDGRTATARFIARNLQRPFRVKHDAAADVTVFELEEPPLGAHDAARLAYQRGSGKRKK